MKPCPCTACARHRKALRAYRRERAKDALSRATLVAAVQASKLSNLCELVIGDDSAGEAVA